MSRPLSSARAALLAAAALSLGGCATTQEGAVVGKAVQGYEQPMDAVMLVDRDLDVRHPMLPMVFDQKDVAVERHGSRRGPTGNLEALVLVRNRLDAPLALELRTTFFDEAKFALGRPSAWQPLNLPPQGTMQYQERSLEAQAAHYYVEVRRAHRR